MKKPRVSHSFIILFVLAAFLAGMIWLVVAHSPDAVVAQPS